MMVKEATLIIPSRCSTLFPSVMVKNVGAVEKGVKIENKALNDNIAQLMSSGIKVSRIC
jgi:hypothetical protein